MVDCCGDIMYLSDVCNPWRRTANLATSAKACEPDRDTLLLQELIALGSSDGAWSDSELVGLSSLGSKMGATDLGGK